MNMEEMKTIAAKDVLVNMLSSKYFDICSLDKSLNLLGVSCACYDSMLILKTLHCTDYTAMNPIIREQVPALVKNVFGYTSMAQHIPTNLLLGK